jgi:hypothetical protein
VQQTTETHEDNNIEQEEYEDEGVDEDLQRQMKNVNLDENELTGGKAQSGVKSKNAKKTSAVKKKKGEDFLEYASKNGIQVNLEYEESKTNTFNKKTPFKKDGKFDNTKPNKNSPQTHSENPNSEQSTQNHSNFKKGTFRGGKKPYNKGISNPNFRKQGNNKFDLCNNNGMPMYNPYMFNNQPKTQGFNYPEPVDEKEFLLKEGTDQGLVSYLENFFSLENMNKDLYLRNRLSEDGFISVKDLAMFNKLKRNSVSVEKIEEVLGSGNEVIESKLQDGFLYLRNREWATLKDQLLSKEQIYQQNRSAKKLMYQNQNQGSTMNYVSLQNNYFINTMPQGGMYPNQEQMFMMPQGQMGQYGYPGMYMYPQYNMGVPMTYPNYHTVQPQQNTYTPKNDETQES